MASTTRSDTLFGADYVKSLKELLKDYGLNKADRKSLLGEILELNDRSMDNSISKITRAVSATIREKLTNKKTSAKRKPVKTSANAVFMYTMKTDKKMTHAAALEAWRTLKEAVKNKNKKALKKMKHYEELAADAKPGQYKMPKKASTTVPRKRVAALVLSDSGSESDTKTSAKRERQRSPENAPAESDSDSEPELPKARHKQTRRRRSKSPKSTTGSATTTDSDDDDLPVQPKTSKTGKTSKASKAPKTKPIVFEDGSSSESEVPSEVPSEAAKPEVPEQAFSESSEESEADKGSEEFNPVRPRTRSQKTKDAKLEDPSDGPSRSSDKESEPDSGDSAGEPLVSSDEDASE